MHHPAQNYDNLLLCFNCYKSTKIHNHYYILMKKLFCFIAVLSNKKYCLHMHRERATFSLIDIFGNEINIYRIALLNDYFTFFLVGHINIKI